ncbi:hypothetical protein NQ315_016681 [Exocentrus adspersus]|uniref:Uncharacterized protein n=1 Tax=Exocentrus adspersus TaxID=1586481 RepID=A0AAV8VP31_9CUCU|nr:hypothetical protein NQ315_016681 [Exocentrus adspersus]
MNRKAMAQEAYCPTAVEHIANIITHGIWIIPSFMGTLKLVNRSRDDNQLLSAVVYGFTLVSLFVISTFFHCVFYCNSFRIE